MNDIDPELDENLEHIAQSIFLNNPLEPNSIKLELELEKDNPEDTLMYENGIDQSIFNILFLITYKGIKILYNHNNLLDLTEEQYILLQKYVNSFGYILEVFGNNTENTSNPKTPWEILKSGNKLTNCTVSFKSFS